MSTLLSIAQGDTGLKGLKPLRMLLVICQIGDWLAGQPDDVASLRNIILEGRRGLDIFLRDGVT